MSNGTPYDRQLPNGPRIGLATACGVGCLPQHTQRNRFYTQNQSPPPHDWVTRVHRALTKKTGSRASLCRPRPPLRLRVTLRGNRQTTRTRIHLSPPRPTKKGNQRQQILIYWIYPVFFAPPSSSESKSWQLKAKVIDFAKASIQKTFRKRFEYGLEYEFQPMRM